MKLTKNSFILSTLLLIITRVFSRMIGFYFRIFLSRTIGAVQLGIYQLALPVLSICIAVTSSGIHTSISRYVAANTVGNKHNNIRYYLFAGLGLSLIISLIFCVPLYFFSDLVAIKFLNEEACSPLIRILILCVPLECIHSCINGYYYGRKKAFVPATGQCIEQLFRVGSVYCIYLLLTAKDMTFNSTHAVIGLFIGEIAASLYALTALSLSNGSYDHLHTKLKSDLSLQITKIKQAFIDIGYMATPLTLNRISLTTLNALENIFIPHQLITYGFNRSDSLGVYGVFTGMALPFIFFPTVLSNSIAVLLLPSVSKAQQEGRKKYIEHAISLSFYFSMLCGFCFTILFFIFGRYIGNYVFHNELAGTFICTLSWVCPFIFLNTTLTSILNGLGKTKKTFYISLCGAFIRLLFVFLVLPFFGMKAYLVGLLCSYVVTSLYSLY